MSTFLQVWVGLKIIDWKSEPIWICDQLNFPGTDFVLVLFNSFWACHMREFDIGGRLAHLPRNVSKPHPNILRWFSWHFWMILTYRSQLFFLFWAGASTQDSKVPSCRLGFAVCWLWLCNILTSQTRKYRRKCLESALTYIQGGLDQVDLAVFPSTSVTLW